MRTLDRQAWFPRSGPDELSIVSWNLLAERYYTGYLNPLDWKATRLPLLQQWLARYACADILCFQEVDREHALSALNETLAEHGFAGVVQDRKGFPVVNAVFFKHDRFSLSWADHRSRALLLGLVLTDGRQLGLVNVHLEAGTGQKNEEQRKAQMTSALSRMRSRKPWSVVVCGDFNAQLQPDSHLSSLLTDSGLTKVPSSGVTFAVHDYTDVLDHIWTGTALRAIAVLGSRAARLRMIEAAGLPDHEHPSDHLPVGAIFSVKQPVMSATALVAPVVEAPVSSSEDVLHEWVEILRMAGLGCQTKAQKRQQRKVEVAFLSTLHSEEALALCKWREDAVSAARAILDGAVLRACAVVRSSHVSYCSPKHEMAAFDPGGRFGKLVRWQGG
mmetsp:Transcript_35123/g.100871  ORF Transcript_35123/g.100871 Transcript_35123/m.100871 type:complete len:388 (+) Transcript_35123:84-1247(+)